MTRVSSDGQLDRDAMLKLGTAIQRAVVGIAPGFPGLRIAVKRGTFYEHRGSFTIEVSIPGTPGIPGTDEVEYRRHAAGLGWPEFGTEFGYRGATYKICGCRPRSKRTPIVTRRLQDGKTYRVAIGFVRSCLAEPT